MSVKNTVLRLTAACLLVLMQPASAASSGIVEKLFVQKAVGATPRTQAEKLGDVVHVKDFGAVCDDVVDDTAAFQRALNHGGLVQVSGGTCKITAPLNIYTKTTLSGAGRKKSTLHFTNAGDGIRSTWPINASTGVWITVRDIGLINTSGSNTGGGFVDVGGTYVDITNVSVSGWKYQVIFDQTEIATLDASELVAGSGAVGLWLVNGADHTPGAKQIFTNRITVSRTQFNAAAGALSNIQDDGGGNHSFRDNNFNAGLYGVRVSGVYGLVISGNEFEGHTGSDIYFADTTVAGDYVGPTVAFDVSGNEIISGSGGQNIMIQNAANGKITANHFGQAVAAINFSGGNANRATGIVIEANSKILSGVGITPGVFVSGFSSSIRKNIIRQVAVTYSVAPATAGQVVITPATMESITVGTRLNAVNPDGTNGEDIFVTATTATTFTTVLTKSKTGNFHIYGATANDNVEGKWTPTLGAAVNGTHTYSVQAGQYFRQGNKVHVKGTITISAKDAAMTGDLRIIGMPFTSENVPNGNAIVHVSLFDGFTLLGGRTQIGGIIAPNSSVIELRKYGSGTTLTPAQASDIPGATVSLLFDAVYYTGDL